MGGKLIEKVLAACSVVRILQWLQAIYPEIKLW